MRLSVYENHLKEVAEIMEETIVPALKKSFDVARNSSRRWHNWFQRPLPVMGVNIYLCVDTRTKWSGGISINIGGLEFNQESGCIIGENDPKLPNNSMQDYRYENVCRVIGVARKVRPENIYRAVENDMLDNN